MMNRNRTGCELRFSPQFRVRFVFMQQWGGIRMSLGKVMAGEDETLAAVVV
jgi:hypothetical protein